MFHLSFLVWKVFNMVDVVATELIARRCMVDPNPVTTRRHHIDQYT